MVMDWLKGLMDAIHCYAVLRCTPDEWYDYLDWIAPDYVDE
jgi:hypothetical protein